MQLVRRLKRWRDLAALRGRAKRSPSPAAYADLAERLIALGEGEEAVKAAEAGLALYPECDRLLHVRLYVMKSRLGGRIRKLREDVEVRPHPGAYAQLAQLYREIGSDDDALAVATECAERFPEHEAAYVTQGEVRFERFRRGLVACDAVIAEKALKQVVRINPDHASAHARLAELYWLVGLPAACSLHLARLLEIVPGAGGVAELRSEIEATPASGTRDATLAELAERVQETRRFANAPERFPRSGPRATAAPARYDGRRVAEAMESLGAHAGLRNAALYGEDGALVAEWCADGAVPSADFGRLVAGVRDTAEDASRRMDTGALLRAEIEGPGGNVLVARTRGLTMALLYAPPMAAGAALALAQDFTSRHVGGGPEAARA